MIRFHRFLFLSPPWVLPCFLLPKCSESFIPVLISIERQVSAKSKKKSPIAVVALWKRQLLSRY